MANKVNKHWRRQRLDIARSNLKPAPFLIFDEPTVNLNPINEKRSLETIFLLNNKSAHANITRGIMFITHRLIGLEVMDEILVPNKWQVFENGTDAELRHRLGLYLYFHERQNQQLATF